MDAWLQNNRGYLVLSLVYAIILGGVLLARQPAPVAIEILDPTPRPSATPAHIVVHVSGAVASPGVYRLLEGSRVYDAVLAAGGLRPEADQDVLNLAMALYDGQRLHISVAGEAPAPAAPAVSDAAAPAAQPGSLININTASAVELESLPGIGAVLAQRIVEDREANGPYGSGDDLVRVRGIGAAVLEKVRPLITVR